jgi:hypothetical protein
MKIMSEFGTMQSETLVTRAETQRRREQKIRSTKSETRNNFQITKIGKIPNKLPSDSVSCIFPIVEVYFLRVCFGFRYSDFGFCFPNVRYICLQIQRAHG